ncbi:hypothetical protein K1719_036324 [Acacia pycnantha]|nr:hypothetical protein K1719_036324 [Acacia pycnantha]
MADNGFKSGFANALQSMMEEKLPGCGIKACPHITSRIKTLKKLWQTAYDMVYGPNTSGFGWDPDTKCVTADKDVWDEYIKYKTKVSNWYDDFEATAKWKRGIEKKEARKIQREPKNKGDTTVSQKRKEPPQVDPKSPAPPTNKKQKAEQVKQGKKKVVVSESSGSDDKGWKPTPSEYRSSDTENDEEDNVRVDKTRARLYKKLKWKQRENVAPEAKADYNQTKLEDYDIRTWSFVWKSSG